MKERIAWTLVGALGSLVVVLSLGARRPDPDDIPPHLPPGTTFYGLVLPSTNEVPIGAVSSSTPIRVHGNEGKWFLLEGPNSPRGPVWVNFDQVVAFRTSQ